MNHHCFPCDICGECYFCLAEIGARCMCEESPETLYRLTVEAELRRENTRAVGGGAKR